MTSAVTTWTKSETIPDTRVNETLRIKGLHAIYHSACAPTLGTDPCRVPYGAKVGVIHYELGSGLSVAFAPDTWSEFVELAAALQGIWTDIGHVRTNFYFAPFGASAPGDSAQIDPEREDVVFGRYLADLLTYSPGFDTPTERDVRPDLGFVFPE